jgi:hypothetical protein
MQDLAGRIPFGSSERGIRMASLGSGRVLSGTPDMPAAEGGPTRLLIAAGIPREQMADDGLRCIRRARSTGFDYFIVNEGSQPIGKWVTLSRPAASAALFDPMAPDLKGIAATRPAGDGISVFLEMAPDQSLIVRTFSGAGPSSPPWRYLGPSAQPPLTIGGDWSVHFLEGGPSLPEDYRTASLGSWSDRKDPEARRFSGTAVYTLLFTLPTAPCGVADWSLDLGRVAESARVRINGNAAAVLWCAPFSTDVGRFIRPGENRLEVEVTNLAANRIRDLDLRHVYWKRFYEINFVGHDYRPFDASGWPIKDSGLMGPVTLTPLESRIPQ